MKRILGFFILYLLIIIAIKPSYADMPIYLQGGYAVTLPDSFELQPKNTVNKLLFSDKNSSAVVSVMSIKNPIEATQDEIQKSIADSIKNSGENLKISYEANENFNGEALVLYGIKTEGDESYSAFIYIFSTEKYSYALICSCPTENEEENAEIFNKIASSLQKKK